MWFQQLLLLMLLALPRNAIGNRCSTDPGEPAEVYSDGRFRECDIPDIWRAFVGGIVGHPVLSNILFVVNKFKTHRHFYTQCHIYINSLVY
ncbi:hypothetical protein DL767_002809 [Monosporascus sp. MG133]|nr:hypothetical protein DL767_002809 [Monosporascus sp. MG133]